MKTLILSASDPGGGNSIVSLIKPLTDFGYTIISVVGGTSRDIWKRTENKYIDGDSLSDSEIFKLFQEKKPSLVVCGTSADIAIEKRIVKLATKEEIPTISVLDFWSNYWQRFSSPRKKDFIYLTDVICVIDDIAKKEMVLEGFDESILRVTGNPYFDHFADNITNVEENHERILFISQPFSELKEIKGFSDYGYDERKVLSDIVSVLNETSYNYDLVIRPHPKEKLEKFNQFEDSDIHISKESNLDLDISKSGLVIGMCSTVLLQAAVAGKAVISYQPNLVGEDPLVSNRIGTTRMINNISDLRAIIIRYFSGDLKKEEVAWPKNGIDNVISVINQVVKK